MLKALAQKVTRTGDMTIQPIEDKPLTYEEIARLKRDIKQLKLQNKPGSSQKIHAIGRNIKVKGLFLSEAKGALRKEKKLLQAQKDQANFLEQDELSQKIEAIDRKLKDGILFEVKVGNGFVLLDRVEFLEHILDIVNEKHSHKAKKKHPTLDSSFSEPVSSPSNSSSDSVQLSPQTEGLLNDFEKACTSNNMVQVTSAMKKIEGKLYGEKEKVSALKANVVIALNTIGRGKLANPSIRNTVEARNKYTLRRSDPLPENWAYQISSYIKSAGRKIGADFVSKELLIDILRKLPLPLSSGVYSDLTHQRGNLLTAADLAELTEELVFRYGHSAITLDEDDDISEGTISASRENSGANTPVQSEGGSGGYKTWS